MQSEVTITLKNEDSTFKKKFLCYDSINLSGECPYIKSMIDQALSEYKAVPEDILLKVTCRFF